jgi:predicted RNA binding protein YcfA (HicA-like mRNA interferase family)/predicted RNase H-like HicB family nuclease
MDDLTEVHHCTGCGEPMIATPVLVCADCGSEIRFRSFTFVKNGKYYAECIDLNLISRGDSEDQAIGRLQEAMFGYIQTALEGDPRGLIKRPSPLSHKFRYHLQNWFKRSRHSGHPTPMMENTTVERRFSHCGWMGRRSYPPLKLAEVIAIIVALKFTVKRTTGSHCHYEGIAADGKRAVVTVDLAISEFDDTLLRSMVKQSGHDRKTFYCATEKTAKKIK